MIIGAGAKGCSTAYHLAKRGIISHIIERGSIAARGSGQSLSQDNAPEAFRRIIFKNPVRALSGRSGFIIEKQAEE